MSTARHIEEARLILDMMRKTNRAGMLDTANVEEFLTLFERELDGLQLALTGTVRLPVMTLTQMGAAAARDRKIRLSLVDGGAR